MGESRLERLLARLQQFYGLLPTPPRAPFALFVWEVLATRSLPSKRDAALTALKRIPAVTPDAMRRAPPAKLEAAVALAGAYAEQRLRALRAGVDLFRRTPELPSVIRGPLPAAVRTLERLPRVGESLTRRMLLFAADRPVFPIDRGLHRVARRLGYGSPAHDGRRSVPVVQRALRRELRREVSAMRRASVYLSHHASVTCTERDPRCGACPLLADCPHGQQRA
ncbi:MAG: hypothetical protein GEU82_11915 [Luteitalea sp.]|nr:hypothetical protein [Luteitalea sp.]